MYLAPFTQANQILRTEAVEEFERQEYLKCLFLTDCSKEFHDEVMERVDRKEEWESAVTKLQMKWSDKIRKISSSDKIEDMNLSSVLTRATELFRIAETSPHRMQQLFDARFSPVKSRPIYDNVVDRNYFRS